MPAPGALSCATVTAVGTPVALADSYDRMEVALVRGSAAGGLGLSRGDTVRFVPRAQAAAGRAAAMAGAQGASGARKAPTRKKAGKKPASKAFPSLSHLAV